MNRSSKPIYVIGICAGGVEKLPLSLQELIVSAERIACPARILTPLTNWWHKTEVGKKLPELFDSTNTNELIHWLKSQNQKTILLASGDPLWFGIGRVLIENLPNREIVFHPSTTSLQLAFARIGRPWQDASWISLHGRDPSPLINLLKKRPNAIAILTDPKLGSPKQIKHILESAELDKIYTFWIFERLGHSEERIYKIMPSQKLPESIDPLNIVVLIKESIPIHQKTDLPLFGIEDGLFIQHDDRPGLMTKREVRVQILADIELPEEGVIWDIGAGVGSIGLEALRIRPKLKLLLVDKRVGSQKLINENAVRLSVKPSVIIESDIERLLEQGTIPKNVSKADRIILGGGEKRDLIGQLLERLNPKGIIVIPLTTLQSIDQIEKIFNDWGCILKISQHQNYRGIKIGKATRLSPMNPVFILKAKLI
ncbi:bifunctional cobalt-precorrin-7 (C(5))-methyltransferase/cobalt-precorrin-6B (C(15))-methyltransferase [Prochlorococcus marinus]|uniref:Putative precorrin-6y methylase n=1 Tax=Prochlorococcus marinus (strain MIT 9211) TaxID=93059 RepID=A9BBN1_PROM4|nr:bifunctional cobalt-precorrin-7 (C(5))-methyltransferase/cobalt-precorrin-6B (C(15))-methyltransferase [Prochlorococcus marinus]ABX09243.1 putative precorrin-6y methylase [Prochlorococcus marinus str. MIT 9211]